jgi:predicted DNA-binding ribbon-helix-helix protein
MTTTIDLPDSIFQEAQKVAAQRKTTFKELVILGLQMATDANAPDPVRSPKERGQKITSALQSLQLEGHVKSFIREDLYDRNETSKD